MCWRPPLPMRALGAKISRDDAGLWTVIGCGVGGLHEPDQILDMGNSGTAARLLMGLVGTQRFTINLYRRRIVK